MNNLVLKPKYVASVSGGKDSVYMLMLILSNIKKYPLDYVVYFDLEIDYPFIKKVIDYLENKLNEYNIPLLRFKPRKSFNDLYNKYGYPSRRVRWCNSMYKLDCEKQLKEFLLKLGCRPVQYIGFCYDEEKRFKYQLGNIDINNKYIYPLAEERIYESDILKWAKNEKIFNDYYIFNKRCGCMGCPMSSMIEWTYLYYYYNNNFNCIISMIFESQENNGYNYLKSSYNDFINKIKNKYIHILKKIKYNYDNNIYQFNIFDYIKEA